MSDLGAFSAENVLCCCEVVVDSSVASTAAGIARVVSTESVCCVDEEMVSRVVDCE